MIQKKCYCPLSSLVVSHDMGYYENRDTDFTSNLYLLGGAFIYSRPEGFIDEKSILASLEINRTMADRVIRKKGKYIQIEDYSALHSPSSEARRKFIDYVSGAENCIAFIFCNLNPILRTAYKLGLPQKKGSVPVLVAHDYGQAVEWAMEIGEREGLEYDRIDPPFPFEPNKKTLFALTHSCKAETADERITRICLINDRILNFRLGNVLDKAAIDKCESDARELLAESGKEIDEAECFLVDCKKLNDLHSLSRGYLIQRIKTVVRLKHYPDVIIYNANNRHAAFARLMSPLIPITIRRTETREEAVRLSLERTTGKAVELAGKKSSDAEALVDLAAGIHWDRPGLDLPEVDRGNPNQKLMYDIMSLIKEEVDYLFREKDRTEEKLKEMYETLKTAQERLVQSEKYNALGQLSAGMAHNINNDLTAIQGCTDLLREEIPQENRIKYLEYITETVDHSANVLKKLLSFSRNSSLKAERIDLDDYLAEVGERFSYLAQGGVNLEVSPGNDVLPVELDRDKFNKVMENLINNAVCAISGGDAIQIEAKGIENPEDVSCSFCHRRINGKWAVLTVRDEGSGITENNMHRIFEPFYTTREFGTGLGLSQVSGIIAQHKGHITVESRKGEGTEVKVYLPLQERTKDRPA